MHNRQGFTSGDQPPDVERRTEQTPPDGDKLMRVSFFQEVIANSIPTTSSIPISWSLLPLMPLTAHTGPFQVGVIDLEIPVRKPRAFAADIVPPDQINRPSKKAQRRAAAAKKQAQSSDKKPTSSSTSHTNDGPNRNDGDDDEEEEEDSANSKFAQWSPFHHGARTSTLYFSTVLFTIYYPSSISQEEVKSHTYHKAAWLGRPKRKGAKALVDYLGQYGLGGPLAAIPASPALMTLIMAKIPAYAGAPLADPSDQRARAPPPDNRIASGLFGGMPPRFPVVVFSHGLAGSRLAYSQVCGELASQGVVVAAIEHRDGSGISSMVRPPIDPSLSPKNQNADNTSSVHASKISTHLKSAHRHAKVKVPYFDFSAIGLRSFPTDPSEKEVGMRQAQLAMRSAEIDECMHVLQRIFQGEGAQVAKESTRTLTTKLCGRSRESPPDNSLAADASLLSTWKGKLDMEYPALVGHSFGGATVMEHLRGQSPQFPYGIIYDPWVEPIIIDESNPRPLRAPVYVVSSEAFTVWEEHHAKVKRLVKDAQFANKERRGWLLTVTGSEHLSFSDFPTLLPRIFRATMAPDACIQMFSRVTLVQMGLLRQRYRERAGKEGKKYGDPEHLKEEENKDETMGVQHNTSNHAAQNSDTEWENFAAEERTHAREEVSNAVGQGKDPLRSGAEDGGAEANSHGKDASDNKRDGSATATTQPTEGASGANADSSSSSYPTADEGRYKRVLNEYTSPKNKSGTERKEAMDTLRDAKARTAATLRAHRRGEKDEEEQQQEAQEEQHHASEDHHDEAHSPPRGVRAHRTPSGGMAAVPRSSKDEQDFTADLHEIDTAKVDQDAPIVVRSVEDISQSQRNKSLKSRSLIGLLYRSYGMKPGLERPGTVLVHDLKTNDVVRS